MLTNFLYRPMVIGVTSADALYGSLWEPSLFLPVMPETVRLIRGLLLYCDEVGMYNDSPEQIEASLNVLREQICAPALTQDEVCGLPPQEWGASFRLRRDEGGAGIFEVAQGEGLPPPPWEFRLRRVGDAQILEYRTAGQGGNYTLAGTIQEGSE